MLPRPPLPSAPACCRAQLHPLSGFNPRTIHGWQRFPVQEQQDVLRRKGHNLTERYRRLENALRGKEALSRQLDDIPRSSLAIQDRPSHPKNHHIEFFRGVRIPEKPRPPEPDECCMSGCAICVHDLYHDALIAYNESLRSIRASLSELQIPEAEWPSSVSTSLNGDNETITKSVSLNAFDALEKALAESRERRGQSGDNIDRQCQPANSRRAD